MHGPMYLQIASQVRDRILSGEYHHGQGIPTERELMKHFSVSRVTVRRALRELLDERLLEVRQGQGYVVQAPTQKGAAKLSCFSDRLESKGIRPGSILISRESGYTTAEESEFYQVALGSEVERVRRVRTADGQPVMAECITLLPERAPAWPWPGGSLYRALEAIDHPPARVVETYQPVLADDGLAARLRVSSHSPLMLVIRSGMTAASLPVEFSRRWFRPDSWQFSQEFAL